MKSTDVFVIYANFISKQMETKVHRSPHKSHRWYTVRVRGTYRPIYYQSKVRINSDNLLKRTTIKDHHSRKFPGIRVVRTWYSHCYVYVLSP